MNSFMWKFDLIVFLITIISLSILLALLQELWRRFKEDIFEKSVNVKVATSKDKMKTIDKMNGIEFEVFAKNFFKKLGYRVKRTPPSKDFGADLLMEKDGKKYVVQVKRYKSNVGISAVQQVVASKAYYSADIAIIFTNSHLTEAASELAKLNNVIVFDRNTLRNTLK